MFLCVEIFCMYHSVTYFYVDLFKTNKDQLKSSQIKMKQCHIVHLKPYDTQHTVYCSTSLQIKVLLSEFY